MDIYIFIQRYTYDKVSWIYIYLYRDIPTIKSLMDTCLYRGILDGLASRARSKIREGAQGYGVPAATYFIVLYFLVY